MRKVGLAVLTAVLLTGAATQTVANDDRPPPSATEVSGAILGEEHVSTEIRTFGNDRLWRVGARFETTWDGAYEDLTAVLHLRGAMSSLDEPGVDEEPFSGGELHGLILSGPVVDWEDF